MRRILSVLLIYFAITPTAVSNISFPARFKNWGVNQYVNAWNITEGDSKVVVAVIDTGIDPNHPDLANNIWQDPNIKDRRVYGWNFITDTANPLDDHSHGTHVAGIIGAISDTKNGVSGVAHRVSIMSIKYYSDANPGSVNLRNTIKAIRYAVDHGASIINYSGGGPEFDEGEYLALKYAESKGVLVVCAAGNEHQDTDRVENYYYPASYRLNNIISVASLDINDKLLPSSNWGKTRVDLAAPGENIYSTLPGKRYGYMTGTSQATPFVTGAAALLKSAYPNLSYLQIKAAILSSVDKLPQLEGKIKTNGKLNISAALVYARKFAQ